MWMYLENGRSPRNDPSATNDARVDRQRDKSAGTRSAAIRRWVDSCPVDRLVLCNLTVRSRKSTFQGGGACGKQDIQTPVRELLARKKHARIGGGLIIVS